MFLNFENLDWGSANTNWLREITRQRLLLLYEATNLWCNECFLPLFWKISRNFIVQMFVLIEFYFLTFFFYWIFVHQLIDWISILTEAWVSYHLTLCRSTSLKIFIIWPQWFTLYFDNIGLLLCLLLDVKLSSPSSKLLIIFIRVKLSMTWLIEECKEIQGSVTGVM